MEIAAHIHGDGLVTIHISALKRARIVCGVCRNTRTVARQHLNHGPTTHGNCKSTCATSFCSRSKHKTCAGLKTYPKFDDTWIHVPPTLIRVQLLISIEKVFHCSKMTLLQRHKDLHIQKQNRNCSRNWSRNRNFSRNWKDLIRTCTPIQNLGHSMHWM